MVGVLVADGDHVGAEAGRQRIAGRLPERVHQHAGAGRRLEQEARLPVPGQLANHGRARRLRLPGAQKRPARNQRDEPEQNGETESHAGANIARALLLRDVRGGGSATAQPARGRGRSHAEDAGRDPRGAAGGARRLHHEGRARQADLHRQGGRAAQPGPPVLPAGVGRHARLRAAARRDRRRHRDGHHLERERGAAAREHPHQAPSAALQRQPQGRQELPGAAARPRRRVAAAGGHAPARRRRRLLLRALPLGDLVPRGAARREPPLPAAHLHRPRAAQPPAPLPAVPDQALPGAVRAAGLARGLRRSGARRAPLSRRQERRAAGPPARAHEGGGGAHRVRGGGRDPRPAARAGGDARGAAGGVERLPRSGRRRLSPRGDRARDRGDVDPQR